MQGEVFTYFQSWSNIMWITTVRWIESLILISMSRKYPQCEQTNSLLPLLKTCVYLLITTNFSVFGKYFYFPEGGPDLTDFICENDPSEFRLSPIPKLAELFVWDQAAFHTSTSQQWMNAIQLKFNSLINGGNREKDSPWTFTECIANDEYILSAFLVVWDLSNVDPRV